ncbi:MAG: cytochrome c bioproteinis protein transmembrane region [Limisphaerales bacterium]|nr:MAG: cytochrome c bioproteinis protein transmembrane region [Limisphaerales bacterium]TXT48840.1 MAG: cytochrome c bioproteinis protein transmembrane region [Limisphaerales bacterium]
MRNGFLALVGCCLLGWFAPPANAAATKVDLLLDKDAAKPGDTVLVGVRLTMAPRWHTYWRNGGDVGFPTKIVWELPAGVTAGEIQWPVPGKYFANTLTSYEYAKEAVLLVPLKLAANAPAGSHELTAKVSWLECETGGSCVPAKQTAKATLNVSPESKPSASAAQFPGWQKFLPTQKPNLVASARWEAPAGTNESRALLVEWSTSTPKPDFFPYGGEGFEVAGPTEVVSNAGGKVVLRKQVKKTEGDWPKQLLGLLVERADEPHPTGYEANLVLSDGSPAAPSAASKQTPTPSPAPPAASGEVTSFGHALLLAFLGGLILNIMPCVLPVIALKIFGFVNQAKESPARVRMLGLVYCLGVLASFVVLAGVVIGVQQAGKNASWGMQFQNPIFLVSMVTLVTLVALNLFGLFEVSLGSGAMTSASELAGKEGPTGAFFNGVLATALATPCTAPLLAPALGFAFAQPPFLILLLFLAIGAGLALPYLLLTFQPAWLKFLPKPGNWMVHFKHAMGFPMLATAIWLLWVSTRIFGRDGALWLGLFLVVLSLAVWIWGEFVQRGGERRGLAMGLSLLLAGGAYAYALEGQLHWRNPAKPAEAGAMAKSSPDGIDWQPWSLDAVTKARAEGRVVLVDFTADWCFTCKANLKSSLEIAATQKKLKELNAVALLADNTLETPAIVSELKKFGRAGVPMVLVYPRDPKAEPMLLPTLLTPSIVLEALDKAAK